MQLAGDTALATAVNATSREILWRVEIDWAQNGSYAHAYSDVSSVVDSVSFNRDLTNVLPVETTMVEGFYSARCTIRLSGKRAGDALEIAKALSPWKSDSPLYGVSKIGIPVRVYVGQRKADGTETYAQQFQGKIVDNKVTSSPLEVTLICGDLAEDLRTDITLPQFAIPYPYVDSLNLNVLYRTNSQWAIDYILRKNGYYMSPPPQQGCFYSATGHGSLIPEIGFNAHILSGVGRASEEDPVYWPGRPGWGLSYGPGTNYRATVAALGASTGFTAQPGQAISLQAQVNLDQIDRPHGTGTLVRYESGAFLTTGASFTLRIISTGVLAMDIRLNGATIGTWFSSASIGTTGFGNAWAIVELGSPLSNSTIRFPTNTIAGVNLSGLVNPVVVHYPGIFTGEYCPTHDIQVCNATGLAPGATLYDPATWVPQADVDVGLNDVMGLPARRGVSSWSLLKEIAGAEFGVIGFTEAGRPFFKNRDTVRRQNLVEDKTLNRSKVLTSFGMSEREGSVRNYVTAQIAQRRVTGQFGGSGWPPGTTIFELKDSTEWILAPGVTQIDFTSDAEQPIVERDLPQSYTTANWNTFRPNMGFVCTSAYGTDVAGITCTAFFALDPATFGPDQYRLIFNNPTSDYCRFATNEGQPALKLIGRSFFTEKSVPFSYSRPNSIARYGQKILDLGSNEWRQLSSAVQRISHSLLKDLQDPTPVVDEIAAVGDLRLQLEDTLLVEDEGVLGGPMLCNLIGLTRALHVSGAGLATLVDAYNVRPFGAPHQWILGHPTRSVLGSTTVT